MKQNNSSPTINLQKYTIIIFPLLSLVVLIVVLTQLILPWYQDVQAKQEEIDTNKHEITQIISKLNTLNKQNVDNLEKYLLDLEMAIPRYPLSPAVMGVLEQTVGEYGLTVSNIQYSGTSENTTTTTAVVDEGAPGADASQPPVQSTYKPKGGTIDVQLTVLGDYYQISSFLKGLHDARPLFTFSGVQISDAQGQYVVNGVTVEKQATMSINSPYLGLTEQLGAVASSVVDLSKDEQDLIDTLDSLKSYNSNGNNQTSSYETGKDNPF